VLVIIPDVPASRDYFYTQNKKPLSRVTYGQSLNGTKYKVELNYPAATLTPSVSLRVFGDEPCQPVRFFFSQDNGRINHGFYEAPAASLAATRSTCKTLLPACLADADRSACVCLFAPGQPQVGAPHNSAQSSGSGNQADHMGV